jgi:hypothetical protein
MNRPRSKARVGHPDLAKVLSGMFSWQSTVRRVAAWA